MRNLLLARVLWMLALFIGLPATAQAQGWPSQPIRIIAPTGAGGSLDAIARILAVKLTQVLNQKVYVENKPGAAGMIGAGFVAKAAPDGYTLLIASNGNLTTTQALFKNVPYDIVRNFAPVSLIAYDPYVLVANPKLAARSIGELIALAKQQPGMINVASSGNGSTPHLALALLNQQTGIKLNHVPYTTSAAGLTSVISGDTSMMFTGIVSGLPFIKNGQLRALGVAGTHPLASLPETPPIAQTVPGFEADNWAGLLMPAGTPAPIIQTMHDDLVKVLQMPDVQQSFQRQGLITVGSSPAEFGTFIKSEITKWGRVIREGNVRPD